MVKVREEIIDEIKRVGAEANRLAIELGTSKYKAYMLQKELDELNAYQQTCIDDLSKLAVKDEDLFKKIQAEYGEGTVDVETGEFLPSGQKQ